MKTYSLLEKLSPIVQRITSPKQKFTQFQSPFTFLSPFRWKKKNKETLVKVTAQGHRPTKRLRFNHKIINAVPLPQFTTTATYIKVSPPKYLIISKENFMIERTGRPSLTKLTNLTSVIRCRYHILPDTIH